MSFVHLHVHSTYSILDGFSQIKPLVARAKELGMPALALTDHGTMFGTVEFFNAAVEAEIKPIIGIETYLAPRKMSDRDSRYDKRAFHLLLLAENMDGYQNLLKIASASQLDGFYYRPRIDRAYLKDHKEGLIVTSGCLSGEIPRALFNNDVKGAEKKLAWYLEVFGREHFFLELQSHNIKGLQETNQRLVDLGKRFKVEFIAANDTHYVNKEDARLQDILLAIQTGSLIADPKRMRMGDDTYYLRTPDEMKALFGNIPGAIENTLMIAERCNVDLTPSGYHLPLFTVPENETTHSYLRSLCDAGLQRIYGEHAVDDQIQNRLNYELEVIHDMGFDAYFLIVWDLCRHATEQGIWYNARGSAAGSLVAFALGINLIDPLEHNLMFERFLQKGRVNMPDIDLDFQDDRRAEMMQYCAEKYGEDKVAQIITFGTMGARGSIRDVARTMDIPISEVNKVANLIPAIPGKPVTIQEVLAESSEMQDLCKSADFYRELVETASKMEGTVRSAGTHAAGVIITDKPIVEYIPLHRPTGHTEETPIKTVTQYEMSIVDYLGLLKVDFLGLTTLTIMSKACELIHKRHGVSYDLSTIPTDDPEVYKFISQGHTTGMFQLEGTGMTRYITEMQPNQLANVIAMVALYRPGPMKFIPDYINRLHKKEKPTYRHPALEPIFTDTFGIPIYQEQIMRAAMELAGYDAGQADSLRKAIAKKNDDKLQAHRKKFIKGAQKHAGISQQDAESIFKDWEEFARYGFNKSHAANYGVIAVQTGFLKYHYTVEYMAALLSAWKNNIDKIATYVPDCRSMGIDVLPPHVNTSGYDFIIEDREIGQSAIRFGLGAIKNVGENPVKLIMEARESGGPFKNLTDFANRVDLRQLGRKAFECLIKVGAFDRFHSRAALLNEMDRIIAVSCSIFKAKEAGQLTLFQKSDSVAQIIAIEEPAYIDKRQELYWERELIGVYVSDHPLSPYQKTLATRVTHFSHQLAEADDKEKVVVAGMVDRFRQHLTKKGNNMGFVTLEDLYGKIDLVIFPQVWERVYHLIEMDKVLQAEGRMDAAQGDPKILVDKITPVSLNDLGNAQPPQPENQPTPEGSATDTLLEEFLPDLPFDEVEPAWGPNDEVEWDQNSPTPMNDDALAANDPSEMIIEEPEDTPEEPNAQDDPIADDHSDGDQKFEDQEPGPEDPAQETSQPSYYVIAPNLPTAEPLPRQDREPRLIYITLEPCGNKNQDVRKMRRIHDILISRPGRDKFAFRVRENGCWYEIDFPNVTTGLTETLIQKLRGMMGTNNIDITPNI